MEITHAKPEACSTATCSAAWISWPKALAVDRRRAAAGRDDQAPAHRHGEDHTRQSPSSCGTATCSTAWIFLAEGSCCRSPPRPPAEMTRRQPTTRRRSHTANPEACSTAACSTVWISSPEGSCCRSPPRPPPELTRRQLTTRRRSHTANPEARSTPTSSAAWISRLEGCCCRFAAAAAGRTTRRQITGTAKITHREARGLQHKRPPARTPGSPRLEGCCCQSPRGSRRQDDQAPDHRHGGDHAPRTGLQHNERSAAVLSGRPGKKRGSSATPFRAVRFPSSAAWISRPEGCCCQSPRRPPGGTTRRLLLTAHGETSHTAKPEACNTATRSTAWISWPKALAVDRRRGRRQR
jgi:hypothetical protein